MSSFVKSSSSSSSLVVLGTVVVCWVAGTTTVFPCGSRWPSTSRKVGLCCWFDKLWRLASFKISTSISLPLVSRESLNGSYSCVGCLLKEIQNSVSCQLSDLKIIILQDSCCFWYHMLFLCGLCKRKLFIHLFCRLPAEEVNITISLTLQLINWIYTGAVVDGMGFASYELVSFILMTKSSTLVQQWLVGGINSTPLLLSLNLVCVRQKGHKIVFPRRRVYLS